MYTRIYVYVYVCVGIGFLENGSNDIEGNYGLSGLEID